jgi:Uncharacterized flavoproteins
VLCEISKGVFWVGAVDWNIRNFHGHTFNTFSGTTYNAYLIIDDKITLIDTVFGPFSRDLLENISAIVPPEKIDYVVANHVENRPFGSLAGSDARGPAGKAVRYGKMPRGSIEALLRGLAFSDRKDRRQTCPGEEIAHFY